MRDLPAHPVLGVVEAARAVVGAGVGPRRVDDHEHHPAARDRGVERLDEIDTRRQFLDVHEEVGAPPELVMH